jgi:glycosyltransferase involved in cell wall biosynthesis
LATEPTTLATPRDELVAPAVLRAASPTQRPVRAPAGRVPPVSVVVLTFNEETNIRDCLLSCAWCDDVHVLDSGSNDRTVEIARAMGATVHVHPFSSFGDQRNWAIDNIPCKHPWHFHLGADERFTEALVEEMFTRLGATGAATTDDAFLCPSKIVRHKQWLKWSGGYPSYQVRLFRQGRCRFVDLGHGLSEECAGTIGTLVQPYTHYIFSHGLLEWFYKHNSYSTREANEAMQARTAPRPGGRAPMNTSHAVHGRALWRFLYNYLLRGGILDGAGGFQYCAMKSICDYWTELKIKERAHPWDRATHALMERMMQEPAGAPAGAGALNQSKGRISVMIPTLNESALIRETVESSLKLGPVFVLDSLSTDGTQELARNAGATVVEQKFLGYAAQKNWGLEHLPIQSEWVFILDADERITPQLRAELLRMIDDPNAADGFFVNRVVLFMGRAVRHGGLYPSWNLRFFRRGKCRYEDRSVHEHMLCDGPTEYLENEMIHIRAESVHEWIRNHIRYADLESDEWVKLRHGQKAGASAKKLFTSTLRYRQYLRREVWPRTPFKPLLRLLYMYVLTLGVLDREAGLHMAAMMTTYEYMIELLYRDKLAREKSGAPDLRSR